MNNEKIRLVVAVVLCGLVIFLYPIVAKKFFPQFGEQPNQPQAVTDNAAKESQAPGTTAITHGEKTPSIKTSNKKQEKPVQFKESIVTVDTPLYTATISSVNGAVKSWVLKNYYNSKEKNSKNVEIGQSYDGKTHASDILNIDGQTYIIPYATSDKKIEINEKGTHILNLKWSSADGFDVEKKINFNADSYAIDTEISVINKTKKASIVASISEIAGTYEVEEKPYYHKGPIRMIGHKVFRQSEDEPGAKGEDIIDWIGSGDKYFVTVVLPPKDIKTAWTSSIPERGKTLLTLSQNAMVNPGDTKVFKNRIFIGPKEFNALSAESRLLDDAIEFGMFSFLAKPTLAVLNFFEKYVKNYGLAIIILTIIIKVVFYPLTKHSLKSMKEMQKMHPQMTALREKYKNDKQKMNQELMDLYKRHKINPLGGCLPMLVQIPIFIALYEVLYVAIELRHSPFMLWIQDLSEKDPYYVTPVLMGVSMFVLQKMTPTAMEPLQEKIMLLMPVVLTVVFINMPSGLVLYWFINNLLQIVQQYHIYKDKSILPEPKKT